METAPPQAVRLRDLAFDPQRLFRALVLISIGTYLAWWFHIKLGAKLISRDTWDALEWQNWGAVFELPDVFSWLFLLLNIATAIGLWNFSRPARVVFAAIITYSVLISPLSGIRVETAVGSVLVLVMHMADGAILALAFTSPVKQCFELGTTPSSRMGEILTARGMRVAQAGTWICVLILLCIAIPRFRDRLQVNRAYKTVSAMRIEEVERNGRIFGVQVIGGERLRLQVARALRLIEIRDMETFVRITNAIGVIREGVRAEAFPAKNPPMIALPEDISMTWCVSALAHEARHIELYRERASPRNSVTPYGGQKKVRGYEDFRLEELECNALAIRVMKRIRGPAHDIRYLQFQNGTHFDANQDGVYDHKDHELRARQDAEYLRSRMTNQGGLYLTNILYLTNSSSQIRR